VLYDCHISSRQFRTLQFYGLIRSEVPIPYFISAGQMLINWFLTAFSEDHYLRLLLTPQDLKILVAQFATHLLAAGVIKQIVDKDAPLESLFRVETRKNS
jgi:hypothetical protein